MIILDTNVVSELMPEEPNPAVRRWVESQDRDALHTTAITRFEIWFCILRLPAGKRRERLERALMAIFKEDFYNDALPFTTAAADACADIIHERDRIERPIQLPDAQIAAIARINDAPLATRDVDDFDHIGLDLVNPWTFAP